MSTSGVTSGGGGGAPETSDRGIFANVSGNKRQGKKGKGIKIEKKRKMKDNCKRKGGKLGNGSRKSYKKRWGLFPFFVVFFVLFCFVLFFFFAFHFWKPRKFVLDLPKWEFSTGKNISRRGKKSGKMTLPPQKNMPVTPLVSTGWIHFTISKESHRKQQKTNLLDSLNCLSHLPLQVTLKVQRIPYGQLVTMHKDQPGQTLGIEVKGNEVRFDWKWHPCWYQQCVCNVVWY